MTIFSTSFANLAGTVGDHEERPGFLGLHVPVQRAAGRVAGHGSGQDRPLCQGHHPARDQAEGDQGAVPQVLESSQRHQKGTADGKSPGQTIFFLYKNLSSI